jgi:hypothetical protein
MVYQKTCPQPNRRRNNAPVSTVRAKVGDAPDRLYKEVASAVKRRSTKPIQWAYGGGIHVGVEDLGARGCAPGCGRRPRVGARKAPARGLSVSMALVAATAVVMCPTGRSGPVPRYVRVHICALLEIGSPIGLVGSNPTLSATNEAAIGPLPPKMRDSNSRKESIA